MSFNFIYNPLTNKKHSIFSYEGKSLLKTINEEVEGRSENRIVRIDTRLLSQDNRVVALRSNNHKFIHYVDQNKFELLKQ